ncbi:MAG: PmoA family protein [Rhodothermales bacterium]
MSFFIAGLFAVALLPLMAAQAQSTDQTSEAEAQSGVQVVSDTMAQRVDVLIDGDLFTAYLYSDTLDVLKKPVLWPLVSAGGQTVTRGYPLAPNPGEQVDHPHHIGLWFNYGDVNGLDFWNNSDAIPAERAGEMGTIRHREIRNTESGEDEGVLETTSDWLTPEGDTLLTEETRYVFRTQPDVRTIDLAITLTALDDSVSFEDNKEGTLGLRMARALEHPEDKAVLLTDASGVPMTEPVLDTTGVSGEYLSSEGLRGTDVWGTRAEWVLLSGTVDDAPVVVAILDQPDNVGYPTYWHARPYGLFAANPLGQAVFSEGEEHLGFKLAPGESTTFNYRIMLLSGEAAASEDAAKKTVESAYQDFKSDM